MNLTEEELEKYKKHPRVLEVRFLTLFDIFEKEYGYQFTMKLFGCICEAFNCNFKFLQAVINKKFELKKRSKVNYKRWRQEVLFSSYVYGESIYKVANSYLNMTPSNLYKQAEYYDVEKFCTDEWLAKLDKAVMICGESIYAVEIERFFEIINGLDLVLRKWRA